MPLNTKNQWHFLKSIGNRLKKVFSMLVSFLGIESHFGKRNRCNKARTILATQQRGKIKKLLAGINIRNS